MSIIGQQLFTNRNEDHSKRYVFILPNNEILSNSEIEFSTMEHPRTNRPVKFIIQQNNLYEIKKIQKGEFYSWFVGNSIIKDGILFLASPLDPTFILINNLQNTKYLNGKEQFNSFVSWDNLIEDYPKLMGFENSAKNICEVKDVDLGEEIQKFYKPNVDKIKIWIMNKFVKLLKFVLPADPIEKQRLECILKVYNIISEYIDIKYLDDIRKEYNIEKLLEESSIKRKMIVAETSVPNAKFSSLKVAEREVKTKKVKSTAKAVPVKVTSKNAITNFFKKV